MEEKNENFDQSQNQKYNDERNTVKNVTRGGQLLLHELHMIAQVLYKVVVWLLPLGLLVGIFWFVLTTNSYSRYIGQQWLWAKFFLWADGNQHQQMFIVSGHSLKVYSSQIVTAPFVRELLPILMKQLKQSLIVSIISYLMMVITVLIWLHRHGRLQAKEKRLKGDYLGSVDELKKLIQKNEKKRKDKKKNSANLIIGIEGLPLPSNSEMQHYLFHGTTGSGKSTGIKIFLDFIRSRGERAIIYDKSCNLVEQFYQPENDQLMNPLDERGADWSLWQECRDKADFDSLAAALIPMPSSTQDPFWVNAARTIFSAAAHRMRKESNPRILSLLRYLLTADISDLQSLLKGTEAETLMSEKTEKTAISVKAVLATYLKSLCNIKDGDQPFSIRHWVQNEGHGWLLISSLGDKHESLKPLITAWLDIAVNALLSLSSSSTRRIWVILDELASLQQLPYLTTRLSEARKFGGCFVVGIQSYAQLAKVYGQEGAREISSLLNTRFMFRVPDPEIAQWSAKNLGETTLEEVREGISYGANSIRDGVSIQRMEREKPVVTYSEILRLEDLGCYVRLPGDYPIIKIHLPYKERLSTNSPFQPRVINQDGLQDEVLELAETVESQSSLSRKKSPDQGNEQSRTRLKSISKQKPSAKVKEIMDAHLFE